MAQSQYRKQRRRAGQAVSRPKIRTLHGTKLRRAIAAEEARAKASQKYLKSLQRKLATETRKAASVSQQKRALAKLVKRDLYSPKKSVRQKPTKYGKSLLQKLADVLSGRAAVVKAPPKTRARYKGQFPTRKGKLIIPKDTPAERIRVNKRGEIVRSGRGVTRGAPGQPPTKFRFRSVVVSSKDDPLDGLPEGRDISYYVRVKQPTGGYGNSKIRFATKDGVIGWMNRYDQSAFDQQILEVAIEQYRMDRPMDRRAA